jgi:hypothetical protein
VPIVWNQDKSAEATFSQKRSFGGIVIRAWAHIFIFVSSSALPAACGTLPEEDAPIAESSPAPQVENSSNSEGDPWIDSDEESEKSNNETIQWEGNDHQRQTEGSEGMASDDSEEDFERNEDEGDTSESEKGDSSKKKKKKKKKKGDRHSSEPQDPILDTKLVAKNPTTCTSCRKSPN